MANVPPWREHFDVAITIDAVNFGASPMTRTSTHRISMPGRMAARPPGDNFSNVEFGAVRTLAEVGSPADALMFFRQGRSFLVIAAENPAAGGRR